MMKILNKCILSTLVYNLFLDRQRNYFIYTAIFLRDIEIHIFKNTTGRKKGLEVIKDSTLPFHF